MGKLCEQRLINKEHICSNAYKFNYFVKTSSILQYFSDKSRNSYKLKCSVLLVMYSWLNGFYCEMNGQCGITLLFFGSNSQRILLLRPRPSVILIASVIIKKLKGSGACWIGYSGFISHEWFLGGEWVGVWCGGRARAHT